MENRCEVNFFWSGDYWTYLHDLTIKSHIVVGHKPIIWLHGPKPKSSYWKNKIYSLYGEIIDANYIMNVDDFIKKGGNWKTASSLWRFTFLYKCGGWYADTDAVAINTWPTDNDWILCNNYEGLISTGALRAPAGDDVFLDVIDNLKLKWGNVKVFNESIKKKYKITEGTIDGNLFFPFIWKDWDILLKSNFDEKVFDGYSIHLYHTMFERAKMTSYIGLWIKQNPNTLLGKLDKWIKESLLDLEQGVVGQ